MKKLVDFFHIGLMKTISKSDGLFPASLFVSDVYLKEQELEYYEVTNKNPVLSENPSLIPATIYDIRSNISDWNIYNGKYDRLMGFFTDNKRQEVINLEFFKPKFFQNK